MHRYNHAIVFLTKVERWLRWSNELIPFTCFFDESRQMVWFLRYRKTLNTLVERTWNFHKCIDASRQLFWYFAKVERWLRWSKERRPFTCSFDESRQTIFFVTKRKRWLIWSKVHGISTFCIKQKLQADKSFDFFTEMKRWIPQSKKFGWFACCVDEKLQVFQFLRKVKSCLHWLKRHGTLSC